MGLVRARLADGRPGPVVGRRLGEEESVDVEGFGGPFAQELIHARALGAAHEVPERVRQDLRDRGIAVWEHAVDLERVAALRAAFGRHNGLCRSNHGQDPSVRSDQVAFVRLRGTTAGAQEEGAVGDEEEADDVADDVLDALEDGFKTLDGIAAGVAEAVGCEVLRPPLGMVAKYRGDGAHYDWHFDNERDEGGHWRNYRVLTSILYLNEGAWTEEAGGHLECEGAGEDGKTLRVAPAGGTVVLFDSRKVRHRVAPARRDRMAMTLWFVGPALLDDAKPPRGPRLEALQAGTTSNKGEDRKRSSDDADRAGAPPPATKRVATAVASSVTWQAEEAEGDEGGDFRFGF